MTRKDSFTPDISELIGNQNLAEVVLTLPSPDYHKRGIDYYESPARDQALIIVNFLQRLKEEEVDRESNSLIATYTSERVDNDFLREEKYENAVARVIVAQAEKVGLSVVVKTTRSIWGEEVEPNEVEPLEPRANGILRAMWEAIIKKRTEDPSLATEPQVPDFRVRLAYALDDRSQRLEPVFNSSKYWYGKLNHTIELVE